MSWGFANFFEGVKAGIEEIILKGKQLSSQAISKLILLIIKDYMEKTEINRIAEILTLELKKGRVDLTFKLKGETEPINLFLEYTLKENIICITKVESKKEWLNALADIFKEKYSRINTSIFGKSEGIVTLAINRLF